MTTSSVAGMRALVFTAPGVVELQDVPLPDVPPGWLPLTVRASGICGSELHGFRSLGFRQPPLIMGHEIAGETPDGRRVVVNPLLSCGTCDLCRLGSPELCRSRGLMGVHLPGGFAEQIAVPPDAVQDIPDVLPWEAAVLIEPLANAVHAWRQAQGGVVERLAVIGAGAIGLVTLLVAAHDGISEVTVVDRARSRLALAERMGASHCTSRLEGEYDVVVDAVGSMETRAAAVEGLRPGGTSVWLGLAEAGSGFDGNGFGPGGEPGGGLFCSNPPEF